MADSKLSALTAGTPAPDDLLYIVQGGASKKATVADLRNTGPLDLAGGTVTTSDPVIDASQTWSASGITFTGIKFNVTDTASAAGSLLMDLQTGSSSRFSVGKNGSVAAIGAISGSFDLRRASDSLLWASWSINTFAAVFSNSSGQPVFGFGYNKKDVNFSGAISFNTGTLQDLGDLILYRDAANTLAQRNGVNAQTHRIYGTYTDASNYRRLTKTMSTAGVAEIKPEGAGTGASGNVLHISGLPTTNPGPGILWNNAGVVNVGT